MPQIAVRGIGASTKQCGVNKRMNSLLKNAGIAQLRCRVIRGAFLYEVKVQGVWLSSNYQFASWIVDTARAVGCKSRKGSSAWSRKKSSISALTIVTGAESSSKLLASTLPTNALSTADLATSTNVSAHGVTGRASSREWKYER